MPRPTSTEVPRLDLAPKLNRPLSLWNPLDYLRLLYWVFYFPQALRWYVDTFGDGFIRPYQMNPTKGSKILREDSVQRLLLLQGILLTIVMPLVLCWLLGIVGISIDWIRVTVGIGVGVVGSVVSGIVYGVAFGVSGSAALGIFSGVAYGIAYGASDGVPLGVVYGTTGSMVLGVISGLALGIALGVAVNVSGGIALGTTGGLALGIAIASFGIILGAVGGGIYDELYAVTGGIAGGIAGGVAFLRPDSYLIASLLGFPRKLAWHSLAATTRLTVPWTKPNLRKWFKADWEVGVKNVNQLLAYSAQFVPVVEVINHFLLKIPNDQILYRVAKLSENPFDWNLIRLASAPFYPFPFKGKVRTERPAHASAAGFWLLHEGKPQAASGVFERVRELLYGQEMYALAVSLALFSEAKTVSEIATIDVPDYPKDPLLRPVTWKAMQRFCNVVSDTKTVVGSVSRTSKAFASNRALGELKHILDYVDEVPEAERQLVENIAKQWRNALLDVATSVGEQTLDRPVQNPYIVGDPVEGSLFVGRDDILQQLEELWLMGRQMQSVVLYGHRRMGKTSILRNAAKTVGAGLRLVYVNMLRSASAESISDVLMAMTDEMSEVLDVHAPSDEELVANPTRAFDRYLKRVLGSLSDSETLIIAIDEFEKIEDLIDTGKLSPDFMAYLRGLVQMSPKLGFAFAGLHTLEEMTQDYFNPFFASVIPIRVGFLSPGAVRQLLANPNHDFLLDYQSEAFDRIYQLTTGQPYLTQLIGFQLVRRYNKQVFEQGNQRESIFTVTDVDAVTADPEFFKRGRYYFTGVWDQAGRDVPEQQAILQALASHPDGLNLDDLRSATKLRKGTLNAALELLQRHDVVEIQGNQAQILVELFRQWLLRQ